MAVVRCHAERDLSQRELAGHLGMKQPQVARLELGEVNPSMETLMRISAQLGIEFTIDVRPAGAAASNVTKPSNVTKRAQQESRSGLSNRTFSALLAPTTLSFSSPRRRGLLAEAGHV